MIRNDYELETTQERIREFKRQVAQIRETETERENCLMSISGFLSEIDRMNLEISKWLQSAPGSPN